MGKVSLEKRMKIIEMSQRMSKREIAVELGTSRHAVQVTQKKQEDVGIVLHNKKTCRPSGLDQ